MRRPSRRALPLLALVPLIPALVASSPVRAQTAPVHDCDRLAAHPADQERVTNGVQWDLMNARAGIQACSAAVRDHPGVLRFQFQLGRALLRARRRDEGLPYLLDAANKGYKAAYALIGGTYQFDLGNLSEALKWYRKGADLKDPVSETHLAEMYMEGWGVKQSMAEALKWYKPSAKDGYALSQYKMGAIFQRGDSTVRRDDKLAVQWYQRAANLGFARAQNDLGWTYEIGQGVPKDLATARGWYLKAAVQGWAKAQINAGRLYEKGLGVTRDYRKAYYWYRRASDARIDELREEGRKGVTRLRHQVSASDIAEVDRRITEERRLNAAAVAAPRAPRPNKVQVAAVDQGYLPPGATGPAGGGVDTGYVPPGGAPAPAPGVDTAYVPPGAAAPDQGTNVDTGYLPPGVDAPATGGNVDTGYLPPGVTPPAAPAPAPQPAPQPQPQVVAKAAPDPPAPASGGGGTVGAAPQFVPIMAPYAATSNANVRSGPSASGQKVASLDKGQAVMVMGQIKGSPWMLVALPNNATGYVHSDLLVASGAPATMAPPAAAAVDDGIPDIDFGAYYALVIGNNAYTDLPALQTAVNDATTVAKILKEDYGFKVKLLTNATRADIIIALDNYRKTLVDTDNILIFYAGHGILDYSSERGYWLPVDASPETQVSWISNATITDTLKAMDAKHAMLVVDSCYSGTLTRAGDNRLQSPDFLRKMVKKRARVALTSGGLEPVADGGGGGDHSVFAKAFIDALLENKSYIEGTKLFLKVRRPVMLSATQTPEFSDIRQSGHDGGDFVFVRRH